MKKLVLAVIAAFAISSPAFASGKIMAQGVHSFNTEKNYLNLLGLSIYEPVFGTKAMFYEGFFGRVFNEYSDIDSRETLTAKNMLGLRLGNLELSGGHQYINAVNVGIEHRALAKVALKLW